MVVTPPSIPASIEYLVGAPLDSYTVPEFSQDYADFCTLVYTIIYDTSQSWLIPLNTRKMEWETNDNENADIYQIIVEVSVLEMPDWGIISSVDYELDVIASCQY